MRPYGQRMGANEYGRHEPEAVVLKKRERQKGRAEVAREKVGADTEATMRRVMDKWLRGS